MMLARQEVNVLWPTIAADRTELVIFSVVEIWRRYASSGIFHPASIAASVKSTTLLSVVSRPTSSNRMSQLDTAIYEWGLAPRVRGSVSVAVGHYGRMM